MEFYGFVNAIDYHPVSYGCTFMGSVVIRRSSYVVIKEGDFCIMIVITYIS